MKHACFVAALALSCTGPAFAQSSGKGTTQAGNPDKIVCKRSVKTGSLVSGKRTCKTMSAWDSEGQAARRQVQEMQDGALINSQKGS